MFQVPKWISNTKETNVLLQQNLLSKLAAKRPKTHNYSKLTAPNHFPPRLLQVIAPIYQPHIIISSKLGVVVQKQKKAKLLLIILLHKATSEYIKRYEKILGTEEANRSFEGLSTKRSKQLFYSLFRNSGNSKEGDGT